MLKFILGCILSLFLLCPSLTAYQYDLCFCLIFRNEAPYLKEWIEFHRLLGGQHFYLYNNLSTDHYQEVLAPYIQEGLVELTEWPHEMRDRPHWHEIQIAAYQDAVDRCTGITKWLAIIDSDEFLFPVHEDSLVKFLSKYEKDKHIGGINVNWVVFGTSNVAQIPDDKLLIETLVLSAGKADSKTKSIVRPERVLRVSTPHFCEYKEGFYHCTPSKKKKQSIWGEIDAIRINHYWTRDEWYLYNFKIPRREVRGTSEEQCLMWNTLGNVKFDNSIFRFITPLRQRLLESNSK